MVALIKFIFIIGMLFPLLQPGQGGGGNRVPITEAIILLISGAIGLGVKYFIKKKEK